MDALYAPQSRSERLIAAGRVVLAASSLFAVWLDPSEPAKYAHIAYSLLAAYLGYSVLLAVFVWRLAPGGSWRLASHGFDLLFFLLFIYFTEGPASPFIAYFVFSLVCATVRWQWRGTLWTALVSLTSFFAAGFYFGEILHDPAFDLNRFIIRGVYLAVIAVLLGYLGAHEQRTRHEMAMLAASPSGVPATQDDLLREQLGYAAGVVGAPRVAMVWAKARGGAHHLASWNQGRLEWHRTGPGELERLLAVLSPEPGMLCPDTRGERPLTLMTSPAGVGRWRPVPLPPEVKAKLEPHSLLAVRLQGESLRGRLLFCDKSLMTADDLLLAEIVAGVVAARFDLFYLTEQLRQTAATEERIRLARDLHDGVLQSMTGFALQLAAVRRLLDEGRPTAARRLEEVQRLIAFEQRDLRFFIAELKPPESQENASASLESRLNELARRIEKEWGLDVELDTEALPTPLADGLARDVYHLLREALFNAARHSEARRVRARLARREPSEITIEVCDDGRGFPFEGRFSEAELARDNRGPKTLRERVASLGGTLELSSGPQGTEIHIVLPLKELPDGSVEAA
ncbi:MAG: sensor histidine kinase [Thermoanaerobaculia bacterium]|nr:sensor histidine kinase [Thermoanaerobaculia bacterium]